MDKSITFITDFIELYRKHHALWKVKDDLYSDRKLKEKGYKQLTELYKTVYEKATIDTVKKKINNLRTAFRKELRKVEKAKKSGASADEIYKPKLWYYKLLVFTEDHEMGRRAVDNDLEESSENMQEYNEYDVDMQADLLKEIGTPSDNAENVSLQFEKENQYSEEAKTYPTASSSFVRNSGGAKSNRKDKEKLLEKACSVIDSRDDEFDIIGANVAHKLRRMNEDQRMQAERFINDILFFGLKRQLNENSEFRVNTGVQQSQSDNTFCFSTQYIPTNTVTPNQTTAASTPIQYTEYQ